MNRKAVPLVLTVLLILLLSLTGCKRSAAPPVPKLPDEGATAENAQPQATNEADAMLDLAAQNSEGNTITQTETLEPTPVATEEATPVAAQPTPVPPTPEPVQPTPVPATEQPTAQPTEQPTASSPGVYIVQNGDNLFRIALKYGLDVNTVAKANGITNPALIYVGQKLVIPTGGSQPGDTQADTTSGGDIVHVVQPGENFFRIALRYNYDYFYLARYNNLTDPRLIYPGQKIRIPNN